MEFKELMSARYSVRKFKPEGYGHSSSAAAEDGMFCGLALDDNNESEKTSSRIGAWVEKLKAHLG